MEKKRRRRRKKKPAIVVVYLLCTVLACFAVYKVSMASFGAGRNLTGTEAETVLGEEVEVYIAQGSSTKDIAEALVEKGLISSAIMFRLNSRMDGYDGTYRHGNYSIAMGTPEEEIMKLLQSGAVYVDALKLTVPEGYTSYQVAEAIELLGIVTKDEFLDEMNNGEFDYEFLKDVPKRDNYLEGYLFPATYTFEAESSAHEIIIKFLDRFEISYNKYLKDAQSEYSADELLIIASLIESEIQVAEERPVAAGVIYNRLNIDMPLQIDSTVQYALNTREEVVTSEDLKVQSPYNTYENKGLPPGPICNPGDAAIEAAVSPDSNKYLYYVVKERGSGAHVYTETYDEFLKAKQEYKNSFNN